MKTRFLFTVAIGLCIASCSPPNTPAPTLAPTDQPELPTAAPTQTPESTPTPKPTRTPIPKPTTTDVPTPMPTQMAILEGRWKSNIPEEVGMNDAFMEFFPDGTFKMESVEEGKFQSQGIFWFDETYMYVAELTETYCQGVGQYIVKLLDNGTLTFMRWDDSCNVRSGTMESFWEKQ